MKILFRFLILSSVVFTAYFVFNMVAMFAIQSSYFWLSYFVSLILSFGVGYLAWRKISAGKESTISNVVLGALILGGLGMAFGIYGPLLTNPRNEQAILGVFLGPPGFILGVILGLIVGRRESNAWNGLLWTCAIASAALVLSGQTFVTSYESKNSNFILKPADIQKRVSTLKYLYVRSLADDDLIKLKKFTSLEVLNFEAGWATDEAKITDNGLKNIMEMNLQYLRALTLSHCGEITDEGMKYVADIPTLDGLGLAACPQITDAGLANLAVSKSIEALDLRGCSGVTDEGLRYLAKMRNLKRLNLGGCSNITTSGIEELQKSLPKIVIEKNDAKWAQDSVPFNKK